MEGRLVAVEAQIHMLQSQVSELSADIAALDAASEARQAQQLPPLSMPPGFVAIGERHDKQGRPLFETADPISVPLERLEEMIREYREKHPVIR